MLYTYYLGSEAVTVHQSTVVNDHKNVSQRAYILSSEPMYTVLVGNSVKIFSTKLFAQLPQHDKFLVKERLHDLTVGQYTRAKLVLKSSATKTKLDIRY